MGLDPKSHRLYLPTAEFSEKKDERSRPIAKPDTFMVLVVGTSTSPGSAKDARGWKSLFDGKTLEGWKVTDFSGKGEVTVEDGAIRMDMGNPMSGITWTGEPPQENYELAFEGMRVRESDFFCTTTFPVGKSPCSLVVGGWGGSVVGLSSIDGYDASENPTTKTINFEQNKWYRVRIAAPARRSLLMLVMITAELADSFTSSITSRIL